MNNLLILAESLKERTLLNVTLAVLIALLCLFSVFGEKSKYLNKTAEMKKTVVIIGFVIFFIFICIYFIF